MSKIVLPSQLVSVDRPDGVDPVWFEKFTEMVAFANLFSEVNFATMTTGQVLIWDSTTRKFHAGSN